MSDSFNFETDYLSYLLENPNEKHTTETCYSLREGELKLLDLGIWSYTPNNKNQTQRIIYSSGIHGNETAPIEILNTILSDIHQETLTPQSPFLMIFGNPRAMKEGRRFIDFNLNRLFDPDKKNEAKDIYEESRANLIKEKIHSFFEHFEGEKIHYDLHTAIRPSKVYRFAISPFNNKDSSLDINQMKILDAMGIEGVLISNAPAPTLSSYSYRKYSAHSFTLELGKVKGFGENDHNEFQQCALTLKSLLTGDQRSGDHKNLQYYRVVKELLRRHEEYQFFIEDEVSNFTPYPKGTLISSDQTETYKTIQDNERIVFPNPQVFVGQRTGLMVKEQSFKDLKFKESLSP